jgi:hypothetical protein
LILLKFFLRLYLDPVSYFIESHCAIPLALTFNLPR